MATDTLFPYKYDLVQGTGGKYDFMPVRENRNEVRGETSVVGSVSFSIDPIGLMVRGMVIYENLVQRSDRCSPKEEVGRAVATILKKLRRMFPKFEVSMGLTYGGLVYEEYE